MKFFGANNRREREREEKEGEERGTEIKSSK